jgi:hypothetical protein
MKRFSNALGDLGAGVVLGVFNALFLVYDSWLTLAA